MTERRRFSRIIYRAPALITYQGQTIKSTVQDLSLHGVLLLLNGENTFNCGDEVEVELTLPESDIMIHIAAHVVETDNTTIRARFGNIDIESISYLRRFVELNVGDDSLLHRELEHLTDLADHMEED
ncbi:PilZ domain-containing protein [Vibrio sp. RC27]